MIIIIFKAYQIDLQVKVVKNMNSETFVLNLRNTLEQPPVLQGFPNVTQLDHLSLEVEVPDTHSFNDLVHQLDEQDIIVDRMRNKGNRLEEVFVKLTAKTDKTGAG